MSRKVILKDTQPVSNNSGSSPYSFDINLFELARVVFEKRRLVIGLTFAVMVLTAVYLLLQPNLYTSTATILPSGKNNSVSALKSLVGLGDFVDTDENSSALYPVVLRSNLVVDAVLEKEYSFTHQSKPMQSTLTDYFDIENRDRLRAALKDATSISSDNRTGEIMVGVETKYPALSQAVLENYLTQLEDFNRNKRRSAGRDNEKYLTQQLVGIGEELWTAEDNLERFQKANIDWAMTGSPEILKELGRLQREVTVKSATYTLLMQELEMARLEAQKDIPIIGILDMPSLPTTKSGPFRRNTIILSGIITFLLLVFTLILRQLITQAIAGSGKEDYGDLRNDMLTAFPRTRETLNRIKSTVREKTPLINS
jgi:uncharacterized protein involved in exopolysaccharide biosynthesis